MSRTNAKEEFIQTVSDIGKVKCAVIWKGYCESEDNTNLKVAYSDDEYQEFLNKLNFNYDSGYGGQELYGIIWFEDGTYCTRGEYDGSEWWEYHCVPDIPDELK